MRHSTFALLLLVFLNVNFTYGYGCNKNDIIHLKSLLEAPQLNGLKLVDQAGTYGQRKKAMKKYNEVARQRDCNKDPKDWTTEQDHMPPKSPIKEAYNEKNPSQLARLLYGKGTEDMLAMTYIKPYHRKAGTTGTFRGNEAVRNLIQEAIEANDVLLTYKYAVLSTNSQEITSTERDFTQYMELYIARMGSIAPKAQIQNWTQKVLGSKSETLKDPAYKALLRAYDLSQYPHPEISDSE